VFVLEKGCVHIATDERVRQRLKIGTSGWPVLQQWCWW